MLVEESKMGEKEGVFLDEPLKGLGYQTIGALQRLGHRTLAKTLVPSNSKATLGVPLHWISEEWEQIKIPFKVMLFTPEPNLGRNQAVENAWYVETLQKIKTLHSVNSEKIFIFVLPLSTPAGDVKIFLGNLAPYKYVLFLSPAIYSFRDQGLFDICLKNYKEFPSSLLNPIKSVHPFPYVFSGDVASFLISVIQRPVPYLKKVIRIPEQGQDLKLFAETFNKEFEVKSSGFFEKILGKAVGHPLESITWIENTEPRSPIPHIFEINALDLFPTKLTALGRSLKQSFDSYRRNPEMEWVFSPSRAI